MSDRSPCTPPGASEPATPTPAELDASCRWPVLALVGGAAFWLGVSAAFALLASVKFHGPNFLADTPWLTYGRVRPAAWNALLYGGGVPLGLGVALWMLSRLGCTRLGQPVLAVAGAQLWHVGVLVGVLGILAGGSTGFDWLEMPRPAAVLLFLGYAFVGVAALATTHRRAVREFYPSQWFLLAALFWFPWIYSTAHLLLVAWPVRGVAQSVIAWWYAANLHVVWLGLVGLAIVFYFVPLLLQRPLHNRHLALVTFWGLVLFGSWSGIPSSAPVPAWIPALSTVAGVLTLVPLLATLLNFGRTVRGGAATLWSQPPLRFAASGFLAYAVAMLMAALEALPGTGPLVQFTWFIPARHQLLLYGFVLAATGGTYHLLPRVSGQPVGRRSVTVQFWAAATGLLLSAVPLAAGGVVQGLKLGDPAVPFPDTQNATLLMLRVSTLGDALLVVANLVFLKNLTGALRAATCAQWAALRAAVTAPAPGQPAAP